MLASRFLSSSGPAKSSVRAIVTEHCQAKDLQLLELFSGEKVITGAFREAGLKASFGLVCIYFPYYIQLL